MDIYCEYCRCTHWPPYSYPSRAIPCIRRACRLRNRVWSVEGHGERHFTIEASRSILVALVVMVVAMVAASLVWSVSFWVILVYAGFYTMAAGVAGMTLYALVAGAVCLWSPERHYN